MFLDAFQSLANLIGTGLKAAGEPYFKITMIKLYSPKIESVCFPNILMVESHENH